MKQTNHQRAAQRHVLHQALQFDKLVILENPNSTRSGDELGLVAALKKRFPADAITMLPTQQPRKPARWLAEALSQKLLGPRTLLAIAGGDGTINHTVEALLYSSRCTEQDRQTVILPLWGGNANDLARMLNGTPSRLRLNQLLQRGRIVAVPPIHFKLMPPRGKATERLAVCYASFGASAAVAHVMNETSFRQQTRRTLVVLRFGRELLLVIRTLARAQRFKVSDPEAESSEQRIFERVFINGPRLAKVERVALKLTDEQFYETAVTRMRLGALFSRALELSDRRFSNKVAQTRFSFHVHDDVLAQFDGEDVALKAGTTVIATVSPTSFNALSFRLKKK